MMISAYGSGMNYSSQNNGYVMGTGHMTALADGSVKMPDGTQLSANSSEVRSMKRSGAVQCSTCAARKYQDGSNESDVSFKAPGHISPQSSGATVAAHERQHVANAYEKASNGTNSSQGKSASVVNASVTLKMSVCPECGRSYVAGGTTHTTIKYSEDAYGQNAKSYDAASGVVGSVIDAAV